MPSRRQFLGMAFGPILSTKTGRSNRFTVAKSENRSFPSDATPNAWKTSTQTVQMAPFNGVSAVMPAIGVGTEFSVSVWGRIPKGVTDAYLFSMGGTGGGADQSIGIYYSGSRPAGNASRYRFSLWATDKDHNKISAVKVPTGTGATTGYGFQSEQWDSQTSQNWAVMYTVQYRAGKIELWATRRCERPRLLVQQACACNGFDPATWTWGNANSADPGPEIELPIVLANRSLSENEIAQLADGIQPEGLGDRSASNPMAVISLAAISDGGTARSDSASTSGPSDGASITLNGQTFTFRTKPVDPVLDIPRYDSLTGGIANAASDRITVTGSKLPAGRRIQISGLNWTGSGTSANATYFVINPSADDFQISLTDGGAAVDIASGSHAVVVNFMPESVAQLVSRLNALTPGTGGASDAQYLQLNYFSFVAQHRQSGDAGLAFTFNSAIGSMPSNRRLAHALAFITDHTGFRNGVFGHFGALRNRANAWIIPASGVLAPNGQITGGVRIDSWQPGTVVQRKGNIGHFCLSGIYTGVAPTGVDVQFLDWSDQSGATVVQDWRSLSSFTVDTVARTFVGRIDCPSSKRWLSFRTRKTNTPAQAQQQSQVPFGVGEVLIMQGDSITGMMASFKSIVAPNGFTSRWSKYGGAAWGRVLSSEEMGAGESNLANKISNDGNCCVAIINISLGGAPVSAFSNANNARTVRAAVDSLALCDANQVACRAGWYLWDQGPADASTTGYGAKLDGLYSWLRTNFGNDIVFAECFQSNRQPTTVDGTIGIDGLRRQQMDWIAGKHGDALVTSLCDDHYFWSNTRDGAHPTDASDMSLKGEMMGMSILKYRGMSAVDGFGPEPVSVTRSGAVVDVTFQLNGATSLQSWRPGEITGFDVVRASTGFLPSSVVKVTSIDPAADVVSINGATYSDGDKILISALATEPGGIAAGTVYYVINARGSAFQLSATRGGSPIDITTAGAGVYATCVNNLLDVASAAILNSNTVRITLAADPRDAVLVHYLWGLPGRKNGDPDITIDKAARSAMSKKDAQSNILFDNFPMMTASLHLPGRPARTTSSRPLKSQA
ncbi:hypothetical protein [Bradyrhizobium jicamae]|uniref:hypothetical protein n=1 Tax=Bradyrhizobium jicamae TaxID=280332 RepID=UPI001BAE4905|nr:hypothetical protein [Bradyrhizobium jicamae]MBR0934901.1 hypothetical protein [Bradyrhizobium jicamae]